MLLYELIFPLFAIILGVLSITHFFRVRRTGQDLRWQGKDLNPIWHRGWLMGVRLYPTRVKGERVRKQAVGWLLAGVFEILIGALLFFGALSSYR